MKTKLFLSILIAAVALHAADDRDNGIPPGLQKKDKLPPGIAKKRGNGAEVVRTNTVTVTNVITQTVTNHVPGVPNAVVPAKSGAPSTPGAPGTPRQVKVDLDKRVHAINTLDNRAGVRRAGLTAIASETGVSVATLQKQQREHQEVGTAGLLMANAIAAQSKRPVGVLFRQHAEGKPWERIAADHQVNLEELDAKLSRVETVMRNAK
jgi:hypothetical protein